MWPCIFAKYPYVQAGHWIITCIYLHIHTYRIFHVQLLALDRAPGTVTVHSTNTQTVTATLCLHFSWSSGIFKHAHHSRLLIELVHFSNKQIHAFFLLGKYHKMNLFTALRQQMEMTKHALQMELLDYSCSSPWNATGAHAASFAKSLTGAKEVSLVKRGWKGARFK